MKEAKKNEDMSLKTINGILAEELMIQRSSILAINVDSTQEEIYEIFIKTKQTNILVYKEHLDEVIGSYSIFKFLENKFNKSSNLNLANNLDEIIFISENTELGYLKSIMQSKKIKIAIIVDEFSSTYGLIYYDFLLEKIEQVLNPNKIIPITTKDDRVILEASLPIDSLGNFLPHNMINESVSNTISGFLIEFIGKLPVKGEKIIVNFYEFVILEVNDRKIDKISIKKI